jgi:O-antigen ligase
MKDFLKAVVFAGIFAVPFLTLYVANDFFFPYITGKNFGFRIIVDIVFAAWILLALYDAQYRPKFSWVLGSFGILLVVMFFANLLGEHPASSFWSNFERMDGYVSLVHTFMYALVLGSVLTTKAHWKYLLNTSLVVATLVALQGLRQYFGLIDGSSRIDSTLGNAAYMAVYMLFHIFIAFWLFVETKGILHKFLYGSLALLLTFVLIETGTRGTAVGLVVGVMVMAAYIGLFGNKFKQYRKYALGGLALVVIAIAAFIGARDSALVQNNPNLARIANISIEDLEIRGIIWGMAWEGVQERPLLGYGQSNFNYVFNENYDPRLYAQEQWFDRSHNIFFDWLVAGGFLGLAAYLGIFVAAVYYLFLQPFRKNAPDTFSVIERGILLGLLAGYFTHNLVVFDNIVSYIFFAIILGLIHQRVATPIQKVQSAKIDSSVVAQVAAPVVVAGLLAVIYFVHLPGIQAAGDVIDAFRQEDPAIRLEIFNRAFDRNSFAQQELTEQLSQQAISLVRNQQVPAEVRDAFLAETETRLNNLQEQKAGDARVHVFIGSYYRTIGDFENAAQQMQLAHELSPAKQAIIIQQGFIELSRNQNEAAVTFFQQAFELDERNIDAREYYAASLFYLERGDESIALMNSPEVERKFAGSDFIISTANQLGRTDFAAELFKLRVSIEPDAEQSWRMEPQNWATLAFLYHQLEESEKAISTLNEAAELIPTFAPTAQCIVENIENDRDPQEGC